MQKNHFIVLAIFAGVSILSIGTAVGMVVGMKQKRNPSIIQQLGEVDLVSGRAEAKKNYLLAYDRFRAGEINQKELEDAVLAAQRAGVLVMGRGKFGDDGSAAALVAVNDEEENSKLNLDDSNQVFCEYFYSPLRGCAVLYRSATSPDVKVYVPQTGELNKRAINPVLIENGKVVLIYAVGDAGFGSKLVELLDMKEGITKPFYRELTEVRVTETGDEIVETVLLPSGRGLMYVQKDRALPAPDLGAGGAPGNVGIEGEIFAITTSTKEGEYQRGKRLILFSGKVPGEFQGDEQFTIQEEGMLDDESAIIFSLGGKVYLYNVDSQEFKVKM